MQNKALPRCLFSQHMQATAFNENQKVSGRRILVERGTGAAQIVCFICSLYLNLPQHLSDGLPDNEIRIPVGGGGIPIDKDQVAATEISKQSGGWVDVQ